MDRKRKWKSLSHKVEYLRLEFEDRTESLQQYEKDFLKELSEATESSSPKEDASQELSTEVRSDAKVIDIDANPNPVSDVESHAKKAEDLPEEIKKLWKMIAAQTHPDKTGNDPRMTELYRAASSAVDSGSIDEIVRIAAELKIDLPEASQTAIIQLEGIAKDLQKKLSDAEKSVLWQWGSAVPEVREKILDAYLKSKNLKRKQ